MDFRKVGCYIVQLIVMLCDEEQERRLVIVACDKVC